MFIYYNLIYYEMGRIQISGYKCERCSHIWAGRGKEEPRVCPKCKSPYWNVPKKIRRMKNG
jgi:rubrerythrin